MTNWVNGPWNPDGDLPVSFKALPKSVYRDDPQWIPEPANNLDAMFSRKNTFFGEHEAWLGVLPDRARLAGFFYNDQSPDEQRTAYFGYFEAIDDVDAASSLFQDFEAWAKDKGAAQIIGPVNFSTYYGNRVRLDNFDANPFFPGEPYNPAYYEPLLTALGYTRFHEYKSWFGDGATIVENLRDIITRVIERTEKQGFTIVTLSPEYWMDNLRAMHHAIDEIFSVGLAYHPISWDLFEQNYGLPIAKKIDPNCSFLVLNTEGQMAAFTLSFPDYGELLHQGGAHRMNPADIEFDRHFDLLKKRLCIAKTVGVRAKHRRLGLFEIMCFKAAEASLEHYDRTSVALIRAGNLSDRSATKVYSSPDCTTNAYGLFSKEISTKQ